MLAECIILMNEVWNPYGSQSIELIGGVGAMRDRKGVALEESFIKTDHWEFKVGFRPPIWCNWDGETLTLTKYSAQWERMQEAYTVPDTN